MTALLRLSLVALLALTACRLHFSTSYRESTFCGPTQDAREKHTRTETLPLACTKGSTLVVKGHYGDVTATVDPSANAVQATITGHGRTAEEAKAVADLCTVTASTDGDTTTVVVKAEPLDIKTDHGRQRMIAQATLDVKVPPGVRLTSSASSGAVTAEGPFASFDATSSFGAVSASSIAGPVHLETRSGAARASRVTGGPVVLSSNFGDVRVSDVDAAEVSCDTTSGAIVVERARAKTTKVKTSFGAIRIVDVTGDVSAETSSGSIELDSAGDARRRLESRFGSITTRGGGGHLEATTSSGDVTVRDFRGKIAGRTGFGSIDLAGVFTEASAESSSGRVSVAASAGSLVAAPWRLSSGFGDVELAVPADFSCRVSARTDFGKVHAGVPLARAAGNSREKTIEGTLGAGGETVALRTSSGNVAIRRN